MNVMEAGADEEEGAGMIDVRDFCAACAMNEPLSFDSLVQIFDKDRKLGCMEGYFVDRTIRQVHDPACTRQIKDVIMEASYFTQGRQNKKRKESFSAQSFSQEVEIEYENLASASNKGIEELSANLEKEREVRQEILSLEQELNKYEQCEDR